MTPLTEYLAKVTLSLAVVGLFYWLVLRRHTFYNWNRWYLLFYSALAFFIPFINLSKPIEKAAWVPPKLIQSVPSFSSLPAPEAVLAVDVNQPSTYPFDDFLMYLFGAGCLLMALRLGILYFSYLRLKKKAELVADEAVKLYHVAADIAPFSFGRAVFVNPALHTEDELREIILHELVHVRQKHTLDVIWAECLCLLNWYNPFAWLIRHAIRQNLEFIADRRVLEQGIDAKAYQYLLLKVVGGPDFRVAHSFNLSSLKQRIRMMNRPKTPSVYLLRFLFFVPLLALLLVVFRKELGVAAATKPMAGISAEEEKAIVVTGLLLDAASGQPIAGLPISLSVNGRLVQTLHTDRDGFYFWRYDLKNNADSLMSYDLLSADGTYFFAKSTHLGDATGDWGWATTQVHIEYLNKKNERGAPHDWFLISDERLETVMRSVHAKRNIKELLLEKLPAFAEEHALKVDFQNTYKILPNQLITKFKKGYFNQQKELMGYESVTEFYLDGKKVDYEEINQTFKKRPVALLKEDQTGEGSFWNKKMVFLTFPLYKDAPPKHLLTAKNVAWKTVEDFDLATLQSEPYFLDGFRQVYGVGSNLIPLKEEIKRVAVFKGTLARYYDQQLDHLWWIETRPAPEIQGRPAFAGK